MIFVEKIIQPIKNHHVQEATHQAKENPTTTSINMQITQESRGGETIDLIKENDF